MEHAKKTVQISRSRSNISVTLFATFLFGQYGCTYNLSYIARLRVCCSRLTIGHRIVSARERLIASDSADAGSAVLIARTHFGMSRLHARRSGEIVRNSTSLRAASSPVIMYTHTMLALYAIIFHRSYRHSLLRRRRIRVRCLFYSPPPVDFRGARQI